MTIRPGGSGLPLLPFYCLLRGERSPRSLASLLMARRSVSFRIIDARSGEPLPGFPSFPSFSAAHKERGHAQGSVSFPLSVARF